MRRTTWIAATSTGLITALSGAGTVLAAPAPPELRIPDQYDGGGQSVIADFNGDGLNDVLVGTDTGEPLQMRPGDGTGGLGPAVVTVLPDGVQGLSDISVDDVDGDDVLDVVVNGPGSPRIILTMIGRGDGSFRPRAALTASGNGAGELTTGDFDGDGDPDLAYSHDTPGSSGDGIEIRKNNGRGKFGSPASYRPPSYIDLDELTAQDVNDDGAVDLVYLIRGSSGCPAVRLNEGNGTFGPQLCSTHVPEHQAWTFGLGDFDGDDAIDIATTDDVGSGVVISRGNNTGRFAFFREYPDVTGDIINLESDDVDGDGRPDLLAGTGGTTALLTGNGDASRAT